MTSKPENSIPILDLSPQISSLWSELNDSIKRVLESGQFIIGPEVKAFEEEVAQYLGVKHAIGLNSGTDALIIGLRALGIGIGDEVITTPFSFFATAEAISSVGASPVFVDIEKDTMNIDPMLIEEAISPRTKAIMPVHIFGQPAAMGQIMEIAEKYDLKVIEDCAQSFGARYAAKYERSDCNVAISARIDHKHTGTIGDIGAYSFFPTKNLGAFGDGGLIVTDSDSVAEKVRMLHKHGAKKKYHNEILGYNSRLDSIQAAILRVKLPYIDLWNQKRRQVALNYNDLLVDISEIHTPNIVDGHVFHQYTILLVSQNRNEIQKKLSKQGIQTMVYYPIPQDQLPIYKNQYQSFPVSSAVSQGVLSLPCWPELEIKKQEQVVIELINTLQN